MSLPNGTTIAQALRPELLHNLPILERLERLLNQPDAAAEYSIEELHTQLRPESLADLAELLCALVNRRYVKRCYQLMTGAPSEPLEYGSLLEVPDTLTVDGIVRPTQSNDLKVLYRRLDAAAPSSLQLQARKSDP